MARKRKSKTLLIVTIIVAVLAIAPMPFIVHYYLENFKIEVNGDEHVNIGLHGVYEEQGATAALKGIDVTEMIEVEGEVDADTPGDYEIKYSVGPMEAVRTVTVGSQMNPELTVEDNGPASIKLGEAYEEAKYSAHDENGKDITSKVKVDMGAANKAGTGTIVYTVTDDNGNATRITKEITVEPNTNYDNPGLPICMYHYVYDENDPPEDLHKRYGNYISAQALEEEINWLKSEDYYFPNWDEVEAYIKGELLLPDKSIVLTFDDGSKSFLECGIPVLEKCQVPATSFVITKNNGAKKVKEYQSEYVSFQSHSDSMHQPGGNVGHGGIFTALSREDAVADLKKSIEIVGNGDAFAYPYGDYTDECVEAVREAGFKCAVTTQAGKAHPGDNPLLLSRQRMSLGQSLEQFKAMVAPR
ncbi:MAG: DUF5011 domain-containing protein [Eubacterium sp.]|nr:DUF5011 domain-containing protein [Candidatus Colimonas fimequi]